MAVMRAAFLDVGGTLWPNQWPSRPTDRQERIARLREEAPSLSRQDASALVAALSDLDHPRSQRQQSRSLVAVELRRLGLNGVVSIGGVIKAMSLAACGRVEPFGGARELLSGLAELGVRVVVVSNVLWREGESLRRDFEDFGLADFVSAYVTSLNVGWRKPHPRIFAAALAAGAVSWHEGVMVGDSEANDIDPPRAHGMLTVRVAIEEQLPATSAADHVCGSLYEVAEVLLGSTAERPKH
jgi:FMN phosphatase YigB (HAD superfamily)